MAAQTHTHTPIVKSLYVVRIHFRSGITATNNKYTFSLCSFARSHSVCRSVPHIFQVEKSHILHVNFIRTARERKRFVCTLFIKCVIFDCVVCAVRCICTCTVHIPLQRLNQRLYKSWSCRLFSRLLHRQYGNVINIVCVLFGFVLCVQHPFYAYRLIKAM